MEEEDLFTLMETCMRESGKMIKHMGKVFIGIEMDHHILENGIKICNTDMGYKTGQMVLRTKGSFLIKFRQYVQ